MLVGGRAAACVCDCGGHGDYGSGDRWQGITA